MNINEIQHHDQRVRRRIPEGAGEPAGQHRRRPRRHVRLHRRSGQHRRCRPSSPSSTASPGTQAGDTTRYAGTNWTNATFLGYPRGDEPEPVRVHVQQRRGCTTATLTNGFVGNTTFRNNAAAAGLPSNFFVANPDMLNGGASLTTNSGGTRANSVQMEFRKRLSQRRWRSTPATPGATPSCFSDTGSSRPLEEIAQAGQIGNVQHAVKGNWIYELPFGQDQRWGSNAERRSWMRSSAAGRSTASARIQTGESSTSATSGSSA